MKRLLVCCVLGLSTMVILAGNARGYPLTAALNSVQVVPSYGSNASGSCKINGVMGDFTAFIDLTCEFSGLSGPLIDADIRDGRAGQNGPGVCGGKRVMVTLPNTGGGTARIECGDGIGYIESWSTKNFYVVLQTSTFPDGEIRGQIKPTTIDSDVNGEGRTEISIFRPADESVWAYCNITNGPIYKPLTEWQPQTDSAPFLADFDGDGIADWSFVRTNAATGVMSILFKSSHYGFFGGANFGNTNYGDVHVFGDFGGIGRIGIAVYRPSDGRWFIMENLSNPGFRSESWGTPAGTPCVGDYNGDGKTELCLVRPENGQLAWYIGSNSAEPVRWGLATDTIYPRSPVDVDADGTNDVLVSRNEDGKRVFYALRSRDGTMFVLQWGLATDAVKLGDYDADGTTDFAAVREIDGHLVWFIYESTNGLRTYQWGLPGDL